MMCLERLALNEMTYMSNENTDDRTLTVFKDLLGELKKYRPLKTNQIADLLGVSPGHLTNILKGRRPVTEIYRQRLEELLTLEKQRRDGGTYLCSELIEIDRELVSLSERDRSEFAQVCKVVLNGIKHKNVLRILDRIPESRQDQLLEVLLRLATSYANETLSQMPKADRLEVAEDPELKQSIATK